RLAGVQRVDERAADEAVLREGLRAEHAARPGDLRRTRRAFIPAAASAQPGRDALGSLDAPEDRHDQGALTARCADDDAVTDGELAVPAELDGCGLGREADGVEGATVDAVVPRGAEARAEVWADVGVEAPGLPE